MQKAINIVSGGKQAQFAKKLCQYSKYKVTQQSVSWWLNRSHQCGDKWAIPIELACKGEVTRHQLRPDIFTTESSEETGCVVNFG